MRSRTGFTLIELMVSMALTLFIMVILSQAFILALDTFSGLKGIGDLQQAMRTAATTLRADLNNYHFDGARRLSDPDIATNPPRQGFFMVYQGRPSYKFDSTTNPTTRLSVSPNTYEGMDPDGVHSYVAVNHVLYFTTRLSGNGYEDFYRTALGTGTAASNIVVNKFLTDFPLDLTAAAAADATLTPLPLAGGQPSFGSAWGEICYYLLQTGTTAEPDNPLSTLGTPIYGLYRALYIVPTNSLQINNTFIDVLAPDFLGVSHGPLTNTPGFVNFLTPSDLANAQQMTTNNAGVTTRRETRTLFMARWNVPGAPFVNPLPLVPPSLTWDFSTGLPRIVPRAFTDVNAFPAPIPPGGLQVLSNVLSFHVQVMPRPDPRFTVYPCWTDPEPQLSGTLGTPGSSVDPNNNDVQSNQARLYDTGIYYDPTTNLRYTAPNTPQAITPPNQTSPPNHAYLYESYPYPVLAVQVTLRVWDPRTQQARQITIVQDL